MNDNQSEPSVISEVINFLFGRKYYANIIHVKGTDRCEISCYIFRTPAQAANHRRIIGTTLSYHYIETVSFRSRNDYR